MPNVDPKIEASWKPLLASEFHAEYFSKLKSFLLEEKAKHTIFPPGDKIFEAFNRVPFNEVKVVILGQDPYHNDGQAHGLCFSVQHGVALPPSLKNIYKELHSDLGIAPIASGNLEKWTDQGVFLLNATLTVRAHEAGAHQKKGWETFTDKVIQTISENKKNVVFILWGNYAQQKQKLIDASKHLIIKSAHPSPLSAHNGFWGSKPFSKTNEYLTNNGIKPINWDLSI
ncbi:MAG: uracil-DNA glycosylase [Bacteroidetes bacterium]|nr:uracil-DNA glycosylase [Bacteroidota bacterium]